jgi:hypothetical protein
VVSLLVGYAYRSRYRWRQADFENWLIDENAKVRAAANNRLFGRPSLAKVA